MLETLHGFRMKIGDLVRVRVKVDDTGSSEEETKIAMIVEGPNEVGNVRLLLPNAISIWMHRAEVEYIPREGVYLKK